jgi:ATP-binding cassette subfamily C (CFTR/MRP) protein 10
MGSLSHRPSLFLLIMFSSSLSLSVLWYESNQTVFSTIRIAMNILYFLSLLPEGKSQYLLDRSRSEREPLINSSYYRLGVDDNEDLYILGAASDGHNFINRMIFYWVNPLIKKGFMGKLRKNDDLFDLPECLNIKLIAEKFQRDINSFRTLFKALHRSFGLEFYLIGILRLLSDVSNFFGPLLLGELLKAGMEENNKNSYYFAIGLFVTSAISAFCGVHFNWKISLISAKMRTALVSSIYNKALDAKNLNATPDILNLMSTDTDRIVNSCISFHSFWSIPFQLFTTLYLLYTQLKFAFIPGVIFAIILIPINRYIATKISVYSKSLMEAKDKRVKLTTEALIGVKQIKLQALEDIFTERISALRKDEIVYLSKRKYLDALCVFFWAVTPVIMCLAVFGCFTLFGQKLTASITYTSVALLNLLIGPLNAFPWVLNGLVEAFVSLRRVQQLIDLDNIDFAEYYSPIRMNYSNKSKDNPVILSIKNGVFCFDKLRDRNSENINFSDVEDFKLENINIEIRQGELIVIDGIVGSGKTSLLNAILGNLKKLSGSVSFNDNENGFGFVSQQCWLQNLTIRENICFGKVYDESRYNDVIKCCALIEDIEKLGGDNVGLGEGE